VTLRTRILASTVVALMIAASCGGTTGEGAAPTAAAKASPAAPAATQAAPVLARSLVILGDTIRSQAGLTDVEKNINAPGIHCTEQSRFPQGGRIVWRMKALDPISGKFLDDKDIASFTITFPDGKSDKLAYGGHGGTKEAPQDFLWAVGYTIPLDYPTGAFNVKIEAKSIAGAVGTFESFKVAAAQLTITKAGQDYPRQ
jgi:hypothetical protein